MNYVEQMDASEDYLRPWDLDSVCEMLSSRKPNSHIMVVRPSRMEHMINYYDNFVTLNRFGGPDYLKGRHAIPHLFHLVHNTLKTVQEPPFRSLITGRELISEDSNVCSNDASQDNAGNARQIHGDAIDSISLVAFSKGCIVLNQLVTELYLLSELPEELQTLYTNFLKKVSEIAWLDGGHQGREGAWITNPNFLKKLLAFLPQLLVTIHVTPYQMHDATRPWIGNECRRFESLCRTAGGNVSFTLHGGDIKNPSIRTHFMALDAYGKSE
ncbi:hypothetical protein HAZT_HAZT009810 [Hyalella azteca]|uniref:Uncharacterized protein n=1 Tax=Hyalella azteca TaxID=294128 RepID=A0A6A0HG16_HYAAZ|nr:hypothetical protein HAZT_HAZT009810 [Hyalella azteca]